MRAHSLDVAIVGGGPGGAAAANAIRRAAPKLNIRVFERASDLNRTGSVVGLSSNGLASLEAIGPDCLDTVRSITVTAGKGGRYTAKGEVLNLAPAGGAPFRLALWYKVQNGLLELLPPGMVELGCDLQRLAVTESDGVELQFRDQDPVHAKVVIGCDGNQSKVRRTLLGDGPPMYLGTAAWRGLTPMPADWPFKDNTYSWFTGMPLGYVLVVSIDDGLLAWHASMHWQPERLAELGDGRYIGGQGAKGTPETRKQRCLDAMAGEFGPAIEDLIRFTDSAAITEHGMFYREPETCQVWGRGPVTLLGDAAHLASPFLGQGLNLALEDAVELGRAIGAYGPTEAALREYERVRVQRATTVQGGSVENVKKSIRGEKYLSEMEWFKLNPWLMEYRPAPLVAQRVPA